MTETQCSFGCGYLSSEHHEVHETYEHARCTECGTEPYGIAGEFGVSHKQDCARLRPGYVYPAIA